MEEEPAAGWDPFILLHDEEAAATKHACQRQPNLFKCVIYLFTDSVCVD